jgi:3-hydroxybutyryl-CoA dehydrogenase
VTAATPPQTSGADHPSIGVVGAGTMGIGIAYVFAAAGCPTTVVEPDPDQTKSAHEQLLSRAQKARERGKLDEDSARSLPDRVGFVADTADLHEQADLAVEAVPERSDLKAAVLGALEQRRPRLLASNTSGLSITELAAGLQDPTRFLGMHFFNPVWAMPLVEIVVGERTTDQTLRQAQDAVALIGKESIVVRDAPGFATSRLGVAIGLEAIRMLEQNVASAEDIDRAMELGYRHPMGPLRLTDLVGLDVRLDIAHNLTKSYGDRFEPPQLLVDKVAAGDLGRKTGRGFHDWSGT